MKYKIKIDLEECIICGSCYSIDPSHFEPDEEGKSMVVGGETDDNISSGVFDDDEIEVAREAEDSCPVSVITVTESAGGVKISITLPENQVKFIDELIEKKSFNDRNQAIEVAVNLLIEQQNKEKT